MKCDVCIVGVSFLSNPKTKGKYSFQKAWSWPSEIENKIESLIETCDNPNHKHSLHVCAGDSRLGDVQVDLYQPPKWNKTFVKADMFALNKSEELAPLFGKFDTVICDPPWHLPYHVRHLLLYQLRDALKIGGLLIFNCIWFPKVHGLQVLPEIYVGVPHSTWRNASLLILARRVYDPMIDGPKVLQNVEPTATGKLCIGLAGKAGAGKTTLAEHWGEKYGFVRLSFAGAVKQVVKDLALEPTRENHQKVGDGLRQLISPEVWIDVIRHRLPAWKNTRIVVDDVRYPNEVEALRKLGFHIIYIDRPKLARYLIRPEMQDPTIASHPSEVALDNTKFSNLINNVGTLKGLLMAGDFMVEQWLAANTRLDVEPEVNQTITKGWVMDQLKLIIEQQMKVVADLNATELSRQKASRIVIQAAKGLAMLGLEKSKIKDILDILAETAKRVEAETTK